MRRKVVILLVVAVASRAFSAGAQDIGTWGSQKPVSLRGSAQIRGIFYGASGIPDRRTPFSYLFAGNLTADLYGVSIPMNFSISEQDRSFSQPFNQFGISPHYKWITLHLGYRNISFSPYTLAGYTLLGAGVELTPGKFRFGFMYGRLNRATTLDTTTQSLAPISFTRKAIAVKLGYGTKDNFIDISMLKGKDDPGSVRVPQGALDSLDVLPAANTVIGISARLALTKTIFFEGDAGTSLYTRDINSPLVLDSLSDPTIKGLRSVAIVNGSSQLYTALRGAIGYKARALTIRLQYQRIDPDFQSMGAYFFNSDLENYTLAPSFHAWKNKLRFNGSIGFQHDNLQHQKEATTHKLIATAMLSADISRQLGIDLNYSNFSNNQQPNTIRFADSLKIVQTTQNLSVSPRWMLIGATFSHTVVLSANMMQMNDFNNYFAQNAISRTMMYKQVYLNYSFGYIPARLTVFVNVSATRADAPGNSEDNKGGTLGFSKSLFKSAFLITASAGYFTGKQGNVNHNTINASANLTYKFLNRHSLNALFFYTNDKPVSTGALNPAFYDTRAELAYGYSF
ncbi:MAG: hypothetical protein Q8937_03620 [Bacteroidota bacterium]|nr:hypothetical protein [Bacteroidota bacterium]